MLEVTVSGTARLNEGTIHQFEGKRLIRGATAPIAYLLDLSIPGKHDGGIAADWVFRSDVEVSTWLVGGALSVRLDHSMAIKRSGFATSRRSGQAEEVNRKQQTFALFPSVDETSTKVRSIVGGLHRKDAVCILDMEISVASSGGAIDRRPEGDHRLFMSGSLSILDHDYSGDSERRDLVFARSFRVGNDAPTTGLRTGARVDDEIDAFLTSRIQRSRNSVFNLEVDTYFREGDRLVKSARDHSSFRRPLRSRNSTVVPIDLKNQANGTDKVSGAVCALLVPAAETDPALLPLEFTASIFVVDDERRGSETEDYSRAFDLSLSSYDAENFIDESFRAGGEVRVELRAFCQLQPDRTVFIFGNCLLFEGRTTGTSDLDGSHSFAFRIDPRREWSRSFVVRNEDEGGDKCKVTFAGDAS